jgi:lactate permease
MAVTGLPGEMLGPDAAILLGIASLACGGIVAYIAAGWRGFIRSLPAVLILSAVMSLTQYWLVTNGIWTLGATGASLAGLIVSVPLARLPIYQKQNKDQPVSFPPQARRNLLIALSAYVVLVVIAFAINLIEPLGTWLGQVTFTLTFPELSTNSGWITSAESGRRISLFNHPGAILLYASIIAALIYWRAGRYSEGSMQRIFDRVLKGSVNASLGIVAMVGLAVLMSHAGMTHMLALGLSQMAGKQAYPLIAPFIGAMGAFITGSNNNSNVLFGILQQRTAELLGLSVTLILAAQTAGGSLGSVMAPAKVIVGSSTVGLGDRESEVM